MVKLARIGLRKDQKLEELKMGTRALENKGLK